MFIIKILLVVTSVFEKILSFTIILGIPSKILGGIIGLIKNFVITFAILYALNLFNITGLEQSTLKNSILNDTPILGDLAGETVDIAKEFASIKDKYKDNTNNNEFNLETLDLFLKYKIVTPETAQKLIDNGKLKIKGAENIINKY